MKKIVPYGFISLNVFLMLVKFYSGIKKNEHCPMKDLGENWNKSGYMDFFFSGTYYVNAIEIIKNIFKK